jgi:hypothetical protein
MLNVFTLANGRLFQEEIEDPSALAHVQPIWVDLEAPTPKKRAGSAPASGWTSPTTRSTTTWRSRPASTKKTTASCTSGPTS